METKFYAVWNLLQDCWVTASRRSRRVNGPTEYQTVDKPLPLPFEELKQWMMSEWWMGDRIKPYMSVTEVNLIIFSLQWTVKEVDNSQFLRERHAMKYL